MFWTTSAYAMGGQGAGAPAEGSALANFIPIILMFAVFYFLLIRPQQKRAKEHKSMLEALKRGDEVVTSGGLYGKVLETAPDYLILDLGDTKVKVSRSAVSAVMGVKAAAEKKGKDKKGDVKPAKSDSAKAEPSKSESGQTDADDAAESEEKKD